jgi:hypothetical protein
MLLLNYQNEPSKLFTNAALSAFLCAVPAISTILAGMARVSTCAGCRENIEWDLIDEKN